MTDLTQITSKDGGTFDVYFSKPSEGSGPGVVMIQEIFGITRWMKEVADHFAGQGYLVAVPDLFWRMQPNFVGSADVEAELKQGFEFRARLDHARAVDDMVSCMDALKEDPRCNGKMAVTGFCLGGTMAYFAATRLKVDAAVSYYGTQIHQHLEEAPNVSCPLILHMAMGESNYTAEDGDRIRAALKDSPHVSIYDYDTGHAFANSDRPNMYFPEETELAHRRTFELLERLK